jgi:hypothetical protein
MMTGKQLRNRNVTVGGNTDPEGSDPQRAEPVTEHSGERIAVSVITDIRDPGEVEINDTNRNS